MSNMNCIHQIGMDETVDGKHAVVRVKARLIGATEALLRSYLDEAGRGNLKTGVLLDLSDVSELGGLTVSYVIDSAKNLVRKDVTFVIMASTVVMEALNAVSHVEGLTVVPTLEAAKDKLGIAE